MFGGTTMGDNSLGLTSPAYALADGRHSQGQQQQPLDYQMHTVNAARAAGGVLYAPHMLMQNALGVVRHAGDFSTAAHHQLHAAGDEGRQQQRRGSVVTSGYNSFHSSLPHTTVAAGGGAAVTGAQNTVADTMGRPRLGRRQHDDLSVDALLDPVKREALRPTPPQELQFRRLELLNRTDVSCASTGGSETVGSMDSSAARCQAANVSGQCLNASSSSALPASRLPAAKVDVADSRPTSAGQSNEAPVHEPYARLSARKRKLAGSANGARLADDLHCRFCPKRCKTYEDLNQHEAACIDARPHECTECFKRFKTKSGLLQHQRIHTQERPYPCSYCDKRFNQKCHVDQHERIHTGEKPFVCAFCGRNFRQRSQQRGHELHCANGPTAGAPQSSLAGPPTSHGDMLAPSAGGYARPQQAHAHRHLLNDHAQHAITVNTSDGAPTNSMLASAAALAALAAAATTTTTAAHAGDETTSSGEASTNSRPA